MTQENILSIKNLPPFYRDYLLSASPSDSKYPELLEVIKKGYSLYLYGAVGTGKTYMALHLANTLLPKPARFNHQTASINKAFFIYEELMQTLLSQPENKANVIFKEVLNNDIVIIDDLAFFSMTPARQENLYLIINGAYTRKVQLIITSNFDPIAIKDIDNRVYDRLLETTYFYQLKNKKRKTLKENQNEKHS